MRSYKKKNHVFLQYGAFALLFLGIKLLIIQSFGNATPFWDQWDAEAANLYEPFLNGTLSWQDLFATHNEHRIFTTRILALILLMANGIWNPLLQMVVNAGLHIATTILLILLITQVIGRKYTPALLLIAIPLFGIPYDWENTLTGFQAQFYFLILFSILSLWFFSISKPFSLRWWIGVSVATLAFFSFASGVFAFASAVFMGCVSYFLRLRRTKKQIIAILILTAGFVAGIAFTPLSSSNAVRTLFTHDFFKAIINIISWPLTPNIFSALFCAFPAIVFMGCMLWKRPDINDRRWFLMSLIVWLLGQDLSVAFGRGGGLAPRYLSLFALSLLINFASFIAISQFFEKEKKRLIKKTSIAWAFIILISITFYTQKHVSDKILERRDTAIIHESNTRNYLLSNDFVYLENKPLFHIPYPSAKRLASILESKIVRNTLPFSIREPINYIAVHKNPDNKFLFNQCCYPSTPKSEHITFGSYGKKGDITTGKIEIEFDFTQSQSPWVAIPIAGYPLAENIKLEIEQNGERTPITMEHNPRESWQTPYMKIRKGIFSIHLTDLNPEIWVAVGMPVEIGRLDRFVNTLLSNYYIFLIMGIVFGTYSTMPD